jgi:type II pantothenate kinase
VSPSTTQPPPDAATVVLAGVDVGATLAKLALQRGSGATAFETLPAACIDEVAERLGGASGLRVGLTGGGAPRLARRLACDHVCIDEFDAWSSGARRLLRRRGAPPERFLLVSVGTGTSAMLVDGPRVRRVGGTALGGGTLLGLGSALLGRPDFEKIAELAAAGDRSRVDLLVSDVYPDGDFLLPGPVNAASFAKLAHGGQPRPEDLAHGLMGLVGENVALICCGLAAAAEVEPIVFGGTTLRGNPALVEILRGACLVLGRKPSFLPDGEFAGALGALAHLDPAGDAAGPESAR